ncbi:SNF2 domain-containing protein CLASSY 2 [Cocos nucifera]|uniref:SNF2 domain-containing protein CLASSY 2 n=1 Tax=Cocos nucifera TaxID=13894 RepID=A0A8K0IZ65_COCNU|nr:SNF2 domain-containing protein CLASSY 2 [Cocos nucifera]
MLKRPPSRCSHPIDATPFEAFYDGSWHGTKHVSIKSGSIFVQFDHRGSMLQDKIHGDCLRMRSRKASSFDCSHFLKPGIDVCVLSAHPIATSSEEELQTPLLSWHDAKIVSIKKAPHVNRCACLFSVVYCKSNSPTSMKRSTNERMAEVVTIDNIAILQKLKNEPCDNGFYRWNSTEDCISSSKSKLLSDAFSSEISWLLVLSTLKRMDFDLKLVQNKIIYHILYSDGRSSITDVQSDGDSDVVSPSSGKGIKVMCFQRFDEYLRPKIETFVLATHKEMPVPERTTEMDINDSDADNDSDVEILYDHMNLRHSKRRKMQPDRFSSYSSPNFDRCSIRNVTCEMNRMEQDEIPTPNSSRSGLSAEEYEGKSMWRNYEGKSMKLKDLCKRVQGGIISSLSNKFDHLSSQSFQKRGSNRKKLLSAVECKHLMEKCIGNIKCETERNVEPVVRWPTQKPTNFPEEPPYFRWTPSVDTQLENEEHEDLWKEMEQSLTTLALLEQNKVLDSRFLDGTTNSSMRDPEQLECHHDYTLKEDIGIICRLCNFICTEIRYVSPPFGDYSVAWKEKFGVKKLGIMGLYDLESDPLGEAISSWDISLSEGCDDIWTLIPDFKSKLHAHQKRAFEFIWRNIAGSLKPEEMNHQSGNTGGCVISHSPGSGKTLLIISFLVSYLKLFPRSRPLVLAPKTAVHTWCREFQKWEAPIPLYLIHREQGYGKELSASKIRMLSIDARRPNRKMMHIMSCLEKLRMWHEEPSILLMNYSSFFSMAKEDSNLEYRRFMASILQKSPGLLILDEGHNPRSTNSKLRKLLMKVKTEYRILLSGTLFQNNFEEYFNTLSLARPRFIHDAISELDPYMVNIFHSRKHKREKKKNRKERLARKLFVEKVGQKIESSEEDDRKQGLDLLNRITTGFVDVHEGEILNMLPGLQIYTLLLSSTDLQRQILTKLQNSVTHKRCPLELESLITVGSIHPWLIKTIAGVDNYFSVDELKNIDSNKENYMCGPKVKFVIDLVHKSTSRGERVLIFCHNISPINLLVEYFELVFGWHREEEVLVLQGDQELSMRAKIMDKFNGDVKGKSKVLLASTTACAEGISLTAASRLVMLDSEWNHSKTRQAIARAFRPGQERVVYVYLLLASGTWEEGKYESNARKALMSKMIFIGQYIEHGSSRQADDIDDELLRELVEEDQRKTFQMIKKHD